RVYNRLDALELALSLIGIGRARDFLEARYHAHQIAKRSHLFDRLNLLGEVCDGELVLLELALELLGLGLVVVLLRLFDQRQHVAHPEDARRQPVRIENLERVEFLTGGRKQNRCAGDSAHRKRRTAPRVGVELGQNHARNVQPLVESGRDVGGFLAGHRVGDEYDVMRIERGLQARQLVHQLFIDLQAAGSVDQNRVMPTGLGAGHRARRDLDRILVLVAVEDRNMRLGAEHAELLHRGGAINVGGRQERMALTFRFQPQRELCNRSRFARALQAHNHDFDGRLDLQIEFARRTAHRVLQLGRDELDQMLFGGERAQYFGAERLGLDVLDKIANDLDIDVGLEQREPDFSERILDIALGDAAMALEFFEDPFEAVAERVKHG